MKKVFTYYMLKTIVVKKIIKNYKKRFLKTIKNRRFNTNITKIKKNREKSFQQSLKNKYKLDLKA